MNQTAWGEVQSRNLCSPVGHRAFPQNLLENIMNIRSSLAVLALGLASTLAFAGTPAASPDAMTPAAKPVVVKHHHTIKCNADQTLVKGKCEAAKKP